MQKAEPFLEYLLSVLRFKKVEQYIPKNSIIADLGCGYQGNFLRHVSSKIKLGIGYDVSVSKKNLPKNVTLISTNLNKKPNAKNNYYDCVAALAVLEHVENPEPFINNARTILKNGGRLIITTPHKKAKPILEFLSLKLGLISKEEILDHKNYFDETTLRRLLDSQRFKNIKIGTFEWGLNLFAVARKAN
ncbi:MAG TPA: class I SAM-dependent methyltransferase [Patescibacteria group bacterium]|nr:class I SAM-dependent methyltransferase [Patescibacteria group bacterium]